MQPFDRPAEVRTTEAPGRLLGSGKVPRASPDVVAVLGGSDHEVRWYTRDGSRVHVDQETAEDDDLALRRLASVDAGCEITWFTVADARMLVQCGGDEPELRLLE